jgi:hypothetical protein
MRKLILLTASFLAMLTFIGAARADDPNPRYTAWAKYSVGSNQTIEGDINRGQMVIHSKTITTLKQVADDHVTVTIQTTVSVNGQDHSQPPHDQDIPATSDASKYKEDGEEDVTAVGKTFKCKVYEFTGAAPAGPPGAASGPSTAKVWACEDVPGGVVKINVSGGAVDVTMLLTAYEAK